MEIKLTDREIEAVGDIKNVLRDIILSNHGNDVEKVIDIFKEVVNEKYSRMKVKILDVRITNNDKIQVFITVNHLKFDFELDLVIPKDDSRFQQRLDECEPWRKTNPKLVESDRKLKEWANSFDDSYEPPYGFFMWVELKASGVFK